MKPSAPRDYVNAVDHPRLIAQLLYNRGIAAADVQFFVDPTLTPEHDVFDLCDMDKAVRRIYRALLQQETIGVFGDFDVDGVTATQVIREALTWLGANVVSYIPNRFTQGHGLHASGVKWLRNQGATLVVTCDCGVSDLAEAEKAASLGIDLIITDHHVPLSRLPKAAAVINAKRPDNRYPYTEFAGVGIAFKLMQAVYRGRNDASNLDQLLELVALGTVADMVALTGENRQFVHKGLQVLNGTTRPGLQALIQVSGLKPGVVTSGDVSWALGPRINSSGRIDDAAMSLRLLETSSQEEAERLASELDAVNSQRQQLTVEVYEHVLVNLAAQADRPLLFASDESYPEGVIGLVAGKVSKEYYRPAVVVTIGTDVCRGSSRSIPEFDLARALEECSELLVTFGGHPMAAGFSVSIENLPALEERLVALAAERLDGMDLQPRLEIDAEVPMKALGGRNYQLMRMLEPFGQHNPEPVFLSRGVEVTECRSLRNHEKWTSLRLRQDGILWDAVDFRTLRGPDDVPKLIDVVYTLRLRRWNGEETLQANIADLAPSTLD